MFISNVIIFKYNSSMFRDRLKFNNLNFQTKLLLKIFFYNQFHTHGVWLWVPFIVKNTVLGTRVKMELMSSQSCGKKISKYLWNSALFVNGCIVFSIYEFLSGLSRKS